MAATVFTSIPLPSSASTSFMSWSNLNHVSSLPLTITNTTTAPTTGALHSHYPVRQEQSAPSFVHQPQHFYIASSFPCPASPSTSMVDCTLRTNALSAPSIVHSSAATVHPWLPSSSSWRDEPHPHVVSPTPMCPKKKVSFASDVQLILFQSPSPEASSSSPKLSWYNESDLALFRDEARLECRKLRLHAWQHRQPPQGVNDHQTQTPSVPQPSSFGENPTQPCASSSSSSSLCSMALNEETRGLEGRMCRERQRRRYLAIQAVVRGQHQVSSAERLAALYQRCTKWAARLAHCEGQRDFQRAYALHHGNTQQSGGGGGVKRVHAEAHPFTECWLSPNDDPDDVFNDRRVRQRVS